TVAVMTAGCGTGAGDQEMAPDTADRDAAQDSAAQDSPASEPDASTRGVVPGLFAIMAGLQRDMAELDRGLWLEDHDVMAAAARAIADHPTVPDNEARSIAGVLGAEMADFKGFDTRVHDLAVRIEALAAEADMDGIVQAQGDLHDGCVACHSAFRARLRAALR
ncbi:MAG TPA: hypothetical protein VLA43_06670, partial [Longimicrobiales bacterium]|nr:hypothetical protein [Longimicrobiales bacterium]